MSIQEVKKNEKYIIRVHLGYSGKKRNVHTETFYGRIKEAEKYEEKLRQKYLNNDLKDGITVSQLISEWLPSISNKIARSTYCKYELHCKKIENGIGHIKLRNVNARILEQYYNDLKKNSGLADRTISDNYAVVSVMFNSAVRWGYIESNPNAKAERPKYKKKEAEYYTPFEVKKLLEVLDNNSHPKDLYTFFRNKALIVFAVDSGCREGEITRLNLGRYRLNKWKSFY